MLIHGCDGHNETDFVRPSRMNARLLRETWVMGLILTLDALSTAALIAMNRAHEANPIMGFFVAKGLIWFILAKIGLFAVVPLFLLELVRRKGKEPFVRLSLRLGITAYVTIYVAGSLSQLL
jgi:hypothetical protein